MNNKTIKTGNKNETGIEISEEKFCISTILEVDDGKNDTADINTAIGKISGL